MSDLADALELTAKGLRNASIKRHLKKYAEKILDDEVTGGPYPRRFNRIIAGRKIAKEFQHIYKGSVFNLVIQNCYNTADANVLTPVLRPIEVWLDGLYAVPKYLVSEAFQIVLSDVLSTSKQLDDEIRSVFGGDSSLQERKKQEFIRLICAHESEHIISVLSDLSKAKTTRELSNMFLAGLKIKKVGNIFFWDHDSEAIWRRNAEQPKGHFYISRSGRPAGTEDLKTFTNLKKAEVAKHLSDTGFIEISSQIDADLAAKQSLSAPTLRLLMVDWKHTASKS
jgi:hypothetical protein